MADRLTLPDWSSLAAQADESVPLLETALLIAVSYTHLDVYKRQVQGRLQTACFRIALMQPDVRKQP